MRRACSARGGLSGRATRVWRGVIFAPIIIPITTALPASRGRHEGRFRRGFGQVSPMGGERGGGWGGGGGGEGRGNKGQAVIDAGRSGLIVGAHLSDAPNDSHQLEAGVQAIAPEAGQALAVLVDKGYDNTKQIARVEEE